MRFSAWIVLVCWFAASGRGVEQLRASYGTFQSPNYPNQYGNNLSKNWTISVRPGFRIKLKFTAFDLEDSYVENQGPCVYDFVLISDDSGAIGRFCGNPKLYHIDAPRINQWMYSKSNTMNIHFESDYSNEGIEPTGFSAEYAETDIDECAEQRKKEYTTVEDWDELIVCNHFCTNTLGSYFCSCRRGFQLHENGHTCVVKSCENKVLTDLQGEIKSPDYPAYYAKLSNCKWDIKVSAGFSINLIFSRHFDIEKHVDHGCVYDILNIRYKNSSDSFCGRTAPRNGSIWDLNTNESRIEFTTDLSVEKMGFKLYYNTTRIRCLRHPRSPSHGAIPPNSKGFYQFKDNVTFSCNRGYDLIGEPVIVCQSNGEWDFDDPKCRLKSCGKPEDLIAVKYSSIEGNVYTYLEKVTVVCDEWYEQRSGYATWRCEDSKQWVEDSGHVVGNSSIPTCRPRCGIKGVDRRTLVTTQMSGGDESSKHEWPWMALLSFGRKPKLASSGPACGGSVISPNYVLTAAHCVLSPHYTGGVRWINHTHVWLKVHNRADKEDTVKYVQAEKIITHEFYNKKSLWDYDIALIKLRETITMGPAVRPVCLPSTDAEYALVKSGESGLVAGWGWFDYTDQPSKVLMQGEFPIVNHTYCNYSFNGSFPSGFELTKNMFCAGYETGNQGTCKGDSGGPFVMKKADTSVFYQTGLVSFGNRKCGRRVSFTGFTKIHRNITNWIMLNTNNLE